MNPNVRFKEKAIDVTTNPVLIVGQNPGRQRKGSETCVVWEGNRSADLLAWVLDGQSNIYLTNVCNYQEITPERVAEGKGSLSRLIGDLQPSHVLCLGHWSYKHVIDLQANGLIPLNLWIAELPHPSWVARFNKDRSQYRETVIRYLNRLI